MIVLFFQRFCSVTRSAKDTASPRGGELKTVMCRDVSRRGLQMKISREHSLNIILISRHLSIQSVKNFDSFFITKTFQYFRKDFSLVCGSFDLLFYFAGCFERRFSENFTPKSVGFMKKNDSKISDRRSCIYCFECAG